MPELSVAWTILPLCVILRQINLYTAWKQMRGGEDRIFSGAFVFLLLYFILGNATCRDKIT